MELPAIHLADLIDTRLEQPPVWIAYPGSQTFQVLVRPLGNRREEFVEKAQKIDWDTAHMARRVVVDQEQYLKLFCAWVIVDWQGLTVADLRRLVLLAEPKKWRSLQGEIGCDEAARLLLMQHSPAFSAWINRVCVDVERFNAEREEDAKKKFSTPSGSGSTTRPSTAGSAARTSEPTASSRIAEPARSEVGTGRPCRSWRSMTWPVPGAIWTRPGWRKGWTTLISRFTSGPCTAGWCWPSTAR